MEIGVQKPGGFEITGKSMSVDIRSIYVKKARSSSKDFIRREPDSLDTKEYKELKSESKSTFKDCGALLAELRQKRSSEGIGFSSFQRSVKKRTKNLSDVGHNLVTLKDNSRHSGPSSCQSPNTSNGCSTVGGNFKIENSFGGKFIIPKRPRGASKWRRTDALAVSYSRRNFLNSESNESKTQDRRSPISGVVITEVSSSKQKRKENYFQKNASVGENSFSNPVKETNSYVETDDVKTRTRSDFVVSEQTSLSENLCVNDGKDNSVSDSQQYEEDNLEENAARMLSSRFNPRCSGFSLCETTSSSKTVEASPNVQPIQASLHCLQTGSSSADASVRTLRPMRHNGKSISRKRRHFYEVLLKDTDPFFIVKQRIRIFWPLDDSWYFGLVMAYDPVTKLHHVQYDDREEEWINLENERFKLLLFPSEVSRKFSGQRIVLNQEERNREGEAMTEYDAGVDNLLDSETFNSWLTRSTHGKKSKPTSILKKQSTKRTRDLKASILLESMGDLCWGASDNIADKQFTNCNVQKWCDQSEVTENPGLKSNSVLEVRKLQHVYSRKRSHERNVVLGKKGDQSIAHFILASSVGNFDSSDSTPAMHHLKIVLPSFRQLTIGLSSSPKLQCIWEFAFATERFLFSNVFSLFDYGKLISVWPVVRMEIIFVDRDIGIRLLLFEGCLLRAVSLLCPLITIFSRCDREKNEHEVPVTLIGIEISSVHCLRGKLSVLMSQFSKLECAKWRNFESRLRSHCVIKELEVANFTNTKWFPTIKAQIISGSVVCDKCLIRMVYTDQLTIQDCGAPNDSFEKISEVRHTQSDNCSFKAVRGHANHNKNVLCTNSDCDSKMLAQNDIHEEHAFVHENSSCEDVAKNSVVGNSIQTFAVKNEQSLAYEKSFSFPHSSSENKLYERCNSFSDAANIQSQSLDAMHNTVPKEMSRSFRASDVPKHMGELKLHSPTAPRSATHHNQNTSVCHTVPKLWQDDFMPNGPLCGFKKPRSQISYPAFSRNYNLGMKHEQSFQQAQSHKRIKVDNVNRISDCNGSSKSYLDCLTCKANILLISEDKGWREWGVHVVLDSDEKNGWNICVKVLGSAKYYHKVRHILQPGATNRYTHAMMWRGGKEWILEFTDRSQWAIFKQIHEECYHRNIRAASIKNIPIPGVRLIADSNDNTMGVTFVRSSSKYFRQVGTYVDFALDTSHVLYDMDSEDEQWISRMNSSVSTDSEMSELTEDLFERIMDMFEKIAYRKQCHEFTSDEIDEFMVGVGPTDVVKSIYEHWRQRRQKKGLPLVRQFQPPMWEFYQQQLEEWESAMSKLPNQQDSYQDNSCSVKKPPMFAFCLRPRGLEIPNKGSKQRSHKKLMYSNHHHVPRGVDGLHTFGKKLDGSSAGEEKTSLASLSYESSDSVHESGSLFAYSPRDTASTESLFHYDGTERFFDQRLYRYDEKTGAFLSPKDSKLTPFSPGQLSKRCGIEGPDSGISQSHCAGIQRCQPDADEFRLRDASSAAQHALNMAKLKREKANWLLHKADVAIHRATVALITAEAIKTSEKDTVGDG